MIVRDLVTRLTFRADTTPLDDFNRTLGGVKKTIAGIAATALSGWAVQSGTNIMMLKEQLRQLEGEAMGPLQQTIEDMTKEGNPFGNMFEPVQLTRAAVALKRLGFEGKDAAEMLRFASLVFVRGGGDIEQVIQQLGSGTMQGGITETLRGLGLLTKETEFQLTLLESRIASSSGDAAELATREFRESVMAVVRQGSPELQQAFDQFLTSDTAAAFRSGVEMKNLWNQITETITQTIVPALRTVNELIQSVSQFVAEWRAEILNTGGAVEALFNIFEKKFPEHKEWIDRIRGVWREFRDWIVEQWSTGLGTGLTIGGALMFLFTKDPIYLGATVAALSLVDLFKNEWSSLEDFLSRPLSGGILAGATVGGLLMFIITKNPAWMLMGAAGGAFAGQELMDFMDNQAAGKPTAPGPLGLAPQGVSREVGNYIRESGAAGSGESLVERGARALGNYIVNTFNININGTGSGSPDEMARQVRQAVQDLLPQLEGSR